MSLNKCYLMAIQIVPGKPSSINFININSWLQNYWDDVWSESDIDTETNT